MAGEIIKVNMGELKIGRQEDILAAYGVGSCIIVACYQRNNMTAGMLHGILPEKPGTKGTNDNKYLNTGIENLVKAMMKEGLSINGLEAKIFGGAKMFDMTSDTAAIGERNIKMAKMMLDKKGIKIAAEDTGSNYGRTIEFRVNDKSATIRSFQKGTIII